MCKAKRNDRKRRTVLRDAIGMKVGSWEQIAIERTHSENIQVEIDQVIVEEECEKKKEKSKTNIAVGYCVKNGKGKCEKQIVGENGRRAGDIEISRREGGNEFDIFPNMPST